MTFADDSLRSDSSTRINYFNPAPTIEEMHMPPETDNAGNNNIDSHLKIRTVINNYENSLMLSQFLFPTPIILKLKVC